MTLARLLLSLVLCLPVTVAFAQTGKLVGTVTDASTGEPLPGVNVAIEGTTQGAVTNVEGFYTILNVRPGTYDLRASFIGFTPQVQQGVRVNVDQTTEINFQLQEEAVGLDEVVVSAARPVVQRDVSASIANIDSEQIENLPVSSVADVISLQAGFEPGLTVRGSGGNQVAFALDGFALTDPRSNNPNTEISFTAIDEVQVQTGGFNAEYGNVRSGLINVITKDPSRSRYTADVILRYSPPSQKTFSDWGNPTDPAVGFSAYPRLSRDRFPGDGNGDGTTSPGETCEVSICGVSILPSYLAKQYEQFGGWRSLATGDLTPEQLREGAEWTYRKSYEITKPDYEVDGTITGPVPGISQYLGNLRFSASYRQTQDAYINPGQRQAETRQSFQGKLVSDVGRGMRLAVIGLHNNIEALAFTGEGIGYVNVGAEMPGYPWDDRNYIEGNIAGLQTEANVFGDYFYSPHDVSRTTVGAEFTHTLSANTFYEIQLHRVSSSDRTGSPARRSDDAAGNSLIVRCVTPDLTIREANTCAANEVALTEAPFGYEEKYEYYGGQAFGSQRGDARDTSDVVQWRARFDITSQLNRFMQVKAGVEYLTSDYDVFYGSWDPANPHQENERFRWQRSPVQGALYGQTKLEFRGMIANLGLRADYFHASGDWYVYDPFSRIFSATLGYDDLDKAPQEPTKRQLTLSPRLGLSFPVTDDSKFYFNYGHFRQMPDPYRLFEIRYYAFTQAIDRVGNPNIPLPKTVAYEVGFEQNVGDMFLVRLAGFYRDLSLGGRNVAYISKDNLVNYQRQEPLGYGDNRGFEVTVEKNRGDWVRGFINYTYLSTKNGGFGYGQINENVREYRDYTGDINNLQQDARVPEPYANMNLEVHFPEDFGPSVGGVNLLGDWRVALLGEWRSGAPGSWDGGQNFVLRGPGNDRTIAYNVKWRDYWNFDLRLSKNFETPIGGAQFYVDFTNVFNIQQMYRGRGYIFQGTDDELDYLKSLHLPGPEELFDGNPEKQASPPYAWVPGDDRPGDFRKPGVAFDPIFAVNELPTSGIIADALYYNVATGQYMTYRNGSWGAADPGRVEQVLDDKAYIDMPNAAYMGFLNPRNVYFGFRISL